MVEKNTSRKNLAILKNKKQASSAAKIPHATRADRCGPDNIYNNALKYGENGP